METIKSFARGVKRTIYIVIIVVIAIILFFVLKNNNTQEQTIIIKNTDFIDQVSVSGKVVAAKDVDLGFYQGGRIASIKAQVGDTVSAGTILANIENGDLQAILTQKEAALEGQQAKLKSLQLGTRPEQITLTLSSVAGAETDLEQAYQSILNTITDAYTTSDDAVRNKVDQFFQNPQTSNPKIILSTNDSSLISDVELKRVSIETLLTSWKNDLGQINSSVNLDKYISETQNNLLQLKLFLDETSIIVNNPNSNYFNASSSSFSTVPGSWKSDVSIARANLDNAVSTLASAVTAYKNAQSTLTQVQNQLSIEKAGNSASDIGAQAAQVKSALADVENAKASLEKTIILAPFTGVVTKMDAKVGEIASPNTSEITMMSADTFQIESYVPEVNISRIKIGENAQVTLDAYGTDTYFEANVVSIDPAETIRDGVSTYKIKLQFTKKDARIKSGMTANILITILDKKNTIVVPGGVVFEQNGKKFVQIMQNKKISNKEITTGSVSALGQVEIISGLSLGDIVLLNPKTN